MIKSKLKELLNDTNTSIKELSESTGINRNSLTQLANGESQMVRFDTLDKLIKYFSLNKISDLLFYAPNESSRIADLKICNDSQSIKVKYIYTIEETTNSFVISVPYKIVDNIIVLNFNEARNRGSVFQIMSMESIIYKSNNVRKNIEHESQLDKLNTIRSQQQESKDVKEFVKWGKTLELANVLDELYSFTPLKQFELVFTLQLKALSLERIKENNNTELLKKINNGDTLLIYQWPKSKDENDSSISYSDTITLLELAQALGTMKEK